MPRTKSKKRSKKPAGRARTRVRPAAAKVKPPRPGMPAADSIISEEPLTSGKGKRYRIIRTNETDVYDKPQEPDARPEPDR